MKKSVFFLVLFGTLLQVQLSLLHPLVSNFEQCRTTRVLDDCMKSAIHEIAKYSTNKIPELGIDRIDPLKIPKMNVPLNVGQGLLNVNLTVQATLLKGISTWQPQKVSINRSKGGFSEVNVLLPTARLHGKYEAVGSVFGINIRGKSTFYYVLHGVNITYKARIKQVDSDPLVGDSTTIYDAARTRMRFNNLIGFGDGHSNDINQLLNENERVIHELVMPVLASKLSPILDNLLTTVLRNLPKKIIDDFYPSKD